MSEMAPGDSRLPAIDWMRGVAMALMAVDHCDAVFNPRHAMGDSASWQQPYPLSAPDFLTRWSTHLCAPAFVFLAGTSIALSAAASRRRGEPALAFDRHLLLRGSVLLLLELTLVSACWRAAAPRPGLFGPFVLQVLFALGVGIASFALLRHLPPLVLGALALALPLLCELLHGGAAAATPAVLPLGILATGGAYSFGWYGAERPFDLAVLYPALPWLPPMLLGFLFGQRLQRAGDPRRLLVTTGTLSLLLFLLVRAADGFGNMALHRRGPGVLEWLHCSKYPPSIAFFLLELGLFALLLAALFSLQFRVGVPWRRNPLLVLGQVPLFFYLLHLPLIGALLFAAVLPRSGVHVSWLAAGLVVLLSWPLCLGYRRARQGGRWRWLRYL